jgi:glutamine cyclotransferase
MEGWGLTNDSVNLIVSDGSSVLYFYDPEYFTQVDQLDVCDNKGLATALNELEYVSDVIWANVYGKPFILKIDAKTGKVLASLNLETLFPKKMPRDMDHVLNGIAYNPDNNTYFVSGKYWPVMYEIRIIE